MSKEAITAKENRITRGTKAEGEISFQSSQNEYTTPQITPENAFRWFYGNIHIQTQIINLLPQVFPGAPDIYVEDANKERVDDLSKWIAKQAANAGVYPSMKISWLDTLSNGCSVKSPGYVYRGNRYEIDEIRDLLAITFRMPPNDVSFWPPPNPLMPGIVWDKSTKKVRVFQSVDDSLSLTEIKNVSIIRDPMSPFPAGRAYCLPVYQTIGKVDHADHAEDQQVNRVGAPLIFPQITDTITPELKVWGDNFVQKWGKDTGFIVPPGVVFPTVKLVESKSAMERLEQLIRWIEVFFNPTTVLAKGSGTTIGSSDSGAMRIWNNYIGGTQAWIEEQYEAFLQPLLSANGYDDVYVRIQLKRPEIDRSSVVAQQLQVGIAGRAVTVEDIRRNLTELDLGEYTGEVEAALREQYAAAIPFGNLAGLSRPEDEIVDETERKIRAANAASLRAIERILQMGGADGTD